MSFKYPKSSDTFKLKIKFDQQSRNSRYCFCKNMSSENRHIEEPEPHKVLNVCFPGSNCCAFEKCCNVIIMCCIICHGYIHNAVVKSIISPYFRILNCQLQRCYVMQRWANTLNCKIRINKHV